MHADVGELEVYWQVLHDLDQSQGLLVFTATPGPESHEELELITLLGTRRADA